MPILKVAMNSLADSYDCVVLGAGPAGCTAATLVAEAGFSTLLVEREKFPRFHVGESLMPETYWPLRRLGVLDQMKASSHPKKFSVQFVSHTGKESQPFYFHKHDDRECSQTWQVLRSDFDKMLFDNAAKKGATCRDETRVLEVLFEESESGQSQRARGVRLKAAGGESRDIAAQVVVDATGQQSLLANRLGMRREDPNLRKAAIWNYYRGAQRDSGIDGGATIILHSEAKRSWFWYIPLMDDVTSVGVVADRDFLFDDGGKPEEIFARELARCPAVAGRIEAAEQIDAFRVAREFSYKAEQPSGEGWVLIGDAYGFVDPVYSSGVYFALVTGEMAADSIVAGLRSDNTSAAQLGAWCPEFEKGVQWVRKLVNAFYTDAFSFGKFMQAHPQYQGNLTDILIGRIFTEEAGAIFEAMDPWIASMTAESVD